MKLKVIWISIISMVFILLFIILNDGHIFIKFYPQLTEKTFSPKYYNKIIFYTGYLTSNDFTYDEYIYNKNIIYLERNKEIYSGRIVGKCSGNDWGTAGHMEKNCKNISIDKFKITDKDFKTFLYNPRVFYFNIQKSFLYNKNTVYNGIRLYPNKYGNFVGNVRYYYKYLYKGEKVTVLCKINKNNEIIPYRSLFGLLNFYDTRLFYQIG